MIGYVPQEPYLYNVSIRENIRYGKPDASWEDIVRAAKLANAHDFILALEHGYETLAGERGNLLSGGQRQRIAIARAILKNAPILIYAALVADMLAPFLDLNQISYLVPCESSSSSVNSTQRIIVFSSS